jgi:hypothetical protein
MDEQGRRLATPKPVDTLIVKLVNAAGEAICWHTVSMADREGPVLVEPARPQDDAFIAQMRGDRS